MQIDRIRLESFRSYERCELSPAPGVNLLYGGNAQGKTNLLESVYYACCARSFRAGGDAELIRFGAPGATLRIDAHAHGRELYIEARLGKKRELSVNGVRKRRVADFAGTLQCVLFCPEDLNLLRDGAQARRRFMDAALSQLRPGYAALLSEYNRVILQKTRILRDYREKPSLLEPLDDFSHRLCELAARIIPYRAALTRALSREAAAQHAQIAGGDEQLEIVYRTVSSVEDTALPASALAPLIWEHYIRHKQAELACGSCLTGIHKDDLEISLDGRSAKQYASQGQARTAALALKLAERNLFRRDTGEYPILLLDDVLSELDAGRQDYILDGIRDGQVFITSCERRFSDRLKKTACGSSGCESFRAFHIEHSAVIPE